MLEVGRNKLVCIQAPKSALLGMKSPFPTEFGTVLDVANSEVFPLLLLFSTGSYLAWRDNQKLSRNIRTLKVEQDLVTPSGENIIYTSMSGTLNIAINE